MVSSHPPETIPAPESLMELFRSGDGKAVVALDIDGTMGDYHKHFLWFAEKWLGIPMPSATEINPGLPLSKFMGVPHHVYRECKLAYRQGGLKRFMPAYPYAAELTHAIRAEAVEVWICTTRPYLRLDNIDPDTREWLRRNRIEYDAVIFEGLQFGDDEYITKYQDLVRQVGVDRIVAAADDLPEQTADAIINGIQRVYLRDQPYNRERVVPGVRVLDLEDLWLQLRRDIAEWKSNH